MVGIRLLSIDHGLRLGIVFAAAATVAEHPTSFMAVSATVHTDRERGLAQGWALPDYYNTIKSLELTLKDR